MHSPRRPIVDNPHSVSGRATSPAGAEQRAAVRHDVLRQGKILFGGRTVYCTVRDLSATGAKLQVGGVELPQRFELMIAGRQGPLRAELKWWSGDYAGVAFEQPLAAADIESVRLSSATTLRAR